MTKISNIVAVKLKNVTKKYIVHHGKPTLFGSLINRKNEEFYSIKNISLEIKKGERVAFVGKNGSGKTTLLKIIAGIVAPTSGEVYAGGKLISIIDPEAGFHPDFTGIENIYLNAALSGFKRSEVSDKLNSIIKLADIGGFIDAPLFTYSSGMKLRLGFAILINFNPDILIADEGLGVGDADFHKKLDKRVDEMVLNGTTLIIATHWADYLEKHCDRIVVLSRGRIIKDGKVKDVLKYIKKSGKNYINVD